MSEPTGRYRVTYLTVAGRQMADFGSEAEATAFAKRIPAGSYPEVLREYESTGFAADFRPIETIA